MRKFESITFNSDSFCRPAESNEIYTDDRNINYLLFLSFIVI